VIGKGGGGSFASRGKILYKKKENSKEEAPQIKNGRPQLSDIMPKPGRSWESGQDF